MSRKIIICLTFLMVVTANAQTSQKGDLALFVDSLISQMPVGISTNDYKVPTSSDFSNWDSTIQNLYAAEYVNANSNAEKFGYSVIRFTDTTLNPGKDFYLLVKKSAGTNYWGTFILNPAPDRQKLFIQSPHPIFDYNTGKQSIRIFRGVGARAYIISGAHRCNNQDSSDCAGTTTVCSGNDEKFKVSDQAHSINSVFQKSTEIILNNIPQLIVIQVHGFAKGNGDPDLIISNGLNIPPDDKYLDTLKTKLLNEDNTLTFKIAHIDTDWTKLIGTTNTQGRLINKSGSPCDTKPTINTGRFLHIEQAKDGLRDTPANWNKLLNAIAETFSIDPQTGIKNDEVIQPRYFRLFQNSPNPFNPVTIIRFYLQNESDITLKIYDMLGREVKTLYDGHNLKGNYSVQWDGKNKSGKEVASGTYFYRISAGNISETKKMILLR